MEEVGVKKITVEQIRNKIKSKKDLYYLLRYHLNYYLPDYDACKMKFLKECLSGKKILLKTSDIRQTNVPKYPDLKVHTFYEYSKTKPELLKFFPDYKKSQKPDREYLLNIIGNEEPGFMSAKNDEAHKNRISGEVAEDNELKKTNYESHSKERAIYLLKKSIKLDFVRRKRKPYQVVFELRGRHKEEKLPQSPKGIKKIRRSNEI